MLERLVHYFWYSNARLSYLLLPFAGVFWLGACIKKIYCKVAYFRRKLPVPIIVVGNISVGGSGKTPLVQYITSLLQQHGFNPAIITRGYKGRDKLSLVNSKSKTKDVGDEALMLKLTTNVPVMVGKNRFLAAKKLISLHSSIDIIIADDGLQHYGLPRDIEIAVIDGDRNFGNNLYFPAGPLRESTKRLNTVDFIVINKNSKNLKNAQDNKSGDNNKNISNIATTSKLPYVMQFHGNNLYNLLDQKQSKPLSSFANSKVLAVAAIGNNARFFDALRDKNLLPIERPFLDHHAYKLKDIVFTEDLPIIVTSKDAVKIRELFYSKRDKFILLVGKNIWVYPIEAKLPQTFNEKFMSVLRLRKNHDRSKVA